MEDIYFRYTYMMDPLIWYYCHIRNGVGYRVDDMTDEEVVDARVLKWHEVRDPMRYEAMDRKTWQTILRSI